MPRGWRWPADCLLRVVAGQTERSERGRLKMELESTLGMEVGTGAETRLWRAVIVSAVEDWVSGGLRTQREAEAYLFGDQTDFPRVCESAGMNMERLRGRLKKLRQPSGVSESVIRRN